MAKVGVMKFDAAPMVTVGPESEIWKRREVPLLTVSVEKTFLGAFVRIVPPRGAKDSRVQEVAQAARDAGAAAVKVVRAREDETVTSPKDAQPHLSAREMVRTMIGESRSRDHEALAAVCGRLLDEQGV